MEVLLSVCITRIGVDEEPTIQKQNIYANWNYSIYHEILIKIVLDEVFLVDPLLS